MFAILTVSCNKIGETPTPSEEDNLKKEIIGTTWIHSERMIYEPPQYNNEDEWNAEVYANRIVYFKNEKECINIYIMSTPNENDVAIIARLAQLEATDYKTVAKNGLYYMIITNVKYQNTWNGSYGIEENKIEIRYIDYNDEEYFAVYEKLGQKLKIVDSSNQYDIGLTYTSGDYAFLFEEIN